VVFSTAARELGLLDIGIIAGLSSYSMVLNADDPIAYLNSLKIKRDFSIAEVVIDSRSIAA